MARSPKYDGGSQLSFVMNAGDLNSVRKNKALLIGGAVFTSLSDFRADGYVKLAPRSTASMLKSFGKKAMPKLYLSVRNSILVSAAKGMRFAVAADAYLQWGFKRKGGVILFGGCEDQRETNLEVFVFKDGVLVAFEDSTLPAQDAPHYQDTFSALVETFRERFPDYKVAQAAPLSKLGERFSDIEYVGEAIFKHLSYKPLVVHAERKFSGALWPAAIVGMSVMFYSLAIGKGWMEYQAAVSAFDAASADQVVKKQGGVDSALIDIIQQRRFFLDEPRRQALLSEKAKQLVAGIGKVPNVKIIEVKLPAPSLAPGVQAIGIPVQAKTDTEQKKPDVWIRISVPILGQPVWDQGEALMQEVAKNTGMNMRLTRNGWTEDAATKRRVYTLEGFIHG